MKLLILQLQLISEGYKRRMKMKQIPMTQIQQQTQQKQLMLS